MPRTSLLVCGRAGTDLASLDSPSDAGFAMLGLLSCVRGEKSQKYSLEMVRQTIFRTIMIGVGTIAMGFYSGGRRDWTQV